MDDDENKSETTIEVNYKDMDDEEIKKIFEDWLTAIKYDVIFIEIDEKLKESVEKIVKYMKFGIIKIIDNELTINFKDKEPIRVDGRITGKETMELEKIKNNIDRGATAIAKITGLSKQEVIEMRSYEAEVITSLMPFLS